MALDIVPKFKFTLLLVLTCSSVHLVTSANILFYFGLTAHSHVSSIWPLLELLSTKGHNVTIVTGVPPNLNDETSVNIVFIPEVFELIKRTLRQDADLVEDRLDGTNLDLPNKAIVAGVQTCNVILHSPSTHNLVYNSHFDLVIIDNSYNECGMLLAAYKYKAPFVFFQAYPFTHPITQSDLGLPLETNSIPDTVYANALDFPGRLFAMLRVFKWVYKRRYYQFEPTEKMVQDAFGLNQSISITDTFKRTSLVLANFHYSTEYARSLPPLFVLVPGMQILEERNPIPKDILEFIEKPGSNGFVYVGFGTLVHFSKCKPELRNKFMYAMGNQTSLRFLWKWDVESVPDNAPTNIYFSKWFPQQDILAHKNIKGYIGQAGINGLHEAMHFGIPLVVFPIMGDQDFNADTLSRKGIAIHLEITSFTQAQLESAIHNVVNNQTLRQNVAETSKAFRDRPMKAVDTALWWLEYVLRHPKNTYLMSPSAHQSIIERWHIDVAAVIFSVITMLILSGLYLVYKIVRSVISSRYGAKVTVVVSRQPRKNGKAKLQ